MNEQPLSRKERRERERQAQRAGGKPKSKMMRNILVWGGTVIGIGLVIWGLVFLAQGEGGTTPTGTVDAVTASDHVKGERTAPAVLIEYGDFQCPACATYESVLQQLSDELGPDLAIVFRHFPLKQIHSNAEAASIASVAADKQGAFWAYHDLLYDRQNDWAQLPNTKATFEGYATELGLNLEQFQADVKDSASKQRVNTDIASGDRAEVQGTPTFFLNGKAIQSPSSFDAFKELITEAIAEAAPTE